MSPHITAVVFISAACIDVVLGAGAAAQSMYKTVGPDGKVTFSDRPAIESASRLSVLRSNNLVPVKAPGDKGEPRVTPLPRPAATPSGAPMTPQIEKTMANVMARAEFARHFYPICNTTQVAARAFTQAASGWKERNLAAIEHQRKLLMQVVSPAKRAEIQESVAAQIKADTAKVTARPAQERAHWCQEAIASMSDPATDINEPAMMAVAIVPYKIR